MADIASRPALAPRMPLRLIAVALVIIALLISAAVFVGSRQTKLPPPFGPAANGFIPYTSGGDIYVGDPTTGQTRLLVGGPEEDVSPRMSPDGTHIAFDRIATGARGANPIDIYVVGQDGSGLHRITPTTLPDWRAIGWTPDGRHVAVAYPTGYSGDGCALAFCLTDQLDLFDASGSGSIVTLARATSITGFTFRPPDGREILIYGQVDGSYGLYATKADGSNLHPVVRTLDPGSDDFWGGWAYAADGDRIFYTRPYAVATPTGTCCDLWVMNADGSDQHQFIPNQGTAWNGQPVVSPDGTKVAFWNGNDVSVARADGAGPFVPTQPKPTGTVHWIWSPDSSKILMFPNDADTGNAFLLDPAGGPYTTVPWTSNGDLDWQRTAIEP